MRNDHALQVLSFRLFGLILILFLCIGCQSGNGQVVTPVSEQRLPAPIHLLPTLTGTSLLPVATSRELFSVTVSNYSGYPVLTADCQWIAIPVEDFYTDSQGRIGTKYNIWISRTPDIQWTPLFSEAEDLVSIPKLKFSPDGKHLAAVNSEGVWFFTTGDWQKRVYYAHKMWGYLFDWSPDSHSVAVVIREGENLLFMMNLDGKMRSLLTMSDVFPDGEPVGEWVGVFDWGPVWLSGGTKVAYISGHNPGSNSLWTVDINTGKKEKLAEDVGDHPILSPDGQKIALHAGDLKMYDLQTHEITTILPTPTLSDRAFLGLPFVWAPDGHRIAVELDYGHENVEALYLLNVDSGAVTKIKSGFITPLLWTKDDKLVTFQPAEGIVKGQLLNGQ
jgi:WD40 repeat protein